MIILSRIKSNKSKINYQRKKKSISLIEMYLSDEMKKRDENFDILLEDINSI